MPSRFDSPEPRYETVIEDGRVSVESPEGPVVVGELDRIVELVGGPAWTIEYSEWTRRRWPDLDTSDEGLTVDVADVTAAMTHTGPFVASLRAMPGDTSSDGASPRLGLFVGRLLANLQSGLD